MYIKYMFMFGLYCKLLYTLKYNLRILGKRIFLFIYLNEILIYFGILELNSTFKNYFKRIRLLYYIVTKKFYF